MNFSYEVCNIGVGSAVRLQVGINPESESGCSTEMRTVKPERGIMLHFFVDGLYGANIGENKLILDYHDIYENHYSQTYLLAVKDKKIDGEKEAYHALEPSGLQKQIKEA